MKMKKSGIIAIIAVAIFGIMVAAHIVLLDGLDGAFFRAYTGGEDTVYSPEYTDSGFRHVRKGDNTGEVLAKLGEPIERFGMTKDASADDGWWYRRPDADAEGWSYSNSRNDGNYRKRIVVFRDGQVCDKVAKFYVD